MVAAIKRPPAVPLTFAGSYGSKQQNALVWDPNPNSTSPLLPGQLWWRSKGNRNQGLRWVGLRGYPTLWMCPAHVLLLSWELPYCMYCVTARSPGAWLRSSGFAGWSPRIPRLALFSAFKLLSCARSLWLMIDAFWFPLQKTWLGAWFVYCALRRLLVLSLVNKLSSRICQICTLRLNPY